MRASVLVMKPEAEQSIYQSENQVVKFGQTSQASGKIKQDCAQITALSS